MKLRMLRNLVLVKLDAKEGVTTAGIVLPHACQDQPTSGVVLESGPDAECKPGDRVHFGKWNGICPLEDHHAAALGYPGAEVYIMRETQDVSAPNGRTLIGDHIYARNVREGESA